MSTQVKNSPKRRARKPIAAELADDTATGARSVSSGRAADGKFARGNVGGPGNPHARHCARMLALMRATVSEEDIVAIIRTLVTLARNENVSAAKLLLSYLLGKPMPAPNPDEIDRDEWEHYQRDTINLEEVQQVLGSVPARVGNDLARTALPIMTQAHQEALASQLVAHLPNARKAMKTSEVATEKPRESAPIRNGDFESENCVTRPKNHDPQSTTSVLPSTDNDAPSTIEDTSPIPNRKLGQNGRGSRATIRDRRAKTNDARSTTNDARPLPNCKSPRKKRAGDSRALA